MRGEFLSHRLQVEKRKTFAGPRSFRETLGLLIFFSDASHVRLIAKQVKRRNLFEL